MIPLDADTHAAFELLARELAPWLERGAPVDRPMGYVDLAAASGGQFTPEQLNRLYSPFTPRGADPEEFLQVLVSTKADGWDAWMVEIKDRDAFDRRLRLQPFIPPQRERTSILAED